MMDREKIIEALETCRDQNNPPGYRFTSCVDDCPYYGNGCARKLKEDVLALLKEQPEIVRCKDCKYHDEEDGKNFCDCGNRPDDWFCADGERR